MLLDVEKEVLVVEIASCSIDSVVAVVESDSGIIIAPDSGATCSPLAFDSGTTCSTLGSASGTTCSTLGSASGTTCSFVASGSVTTGSLVICSLPASVASAV